LHQIWEEADSFVLSCRGVTELGDGARVSKHRAHLVLSKENNEHFWSKASEEFIEWVCNPTAKVVTRAFGGCQEPLQFQLNVGLKQGWEHLHASDKEGAARWLHPCPEKAQTSAFFMDHFLLQDDPNSATSC
jgi:hypothetical protein